MWTEQEPTKNVDQLKKISCCLTIIKVYFILYEIDLLNHFKITAILKYGSKFSDFTQ